jgi:TatA/E family protein of Tat protein translocase
MFGVGGQEIVIIGLLFLVIFGPSKLPQMARDLGRFVNEARRSIDEFKDELTAIEDEKDEEKPPGRSRRDRDAGPERADEDEHDL